MPLRDIGKDRIKSEDMNQGLPDSRSLILKCEAIFSLRIFLLSRSLTLSCKN